MQTSTIIIISIIAIVSFAFILFGIAIEGKKNETKAIKKPYKYKKQTLSSCVANDLKNLEKGEGFTTCEEDDDTLTPFLDPAYRTGCNIQMLE